MTEEERNYFDAVLEEVLAEAPRVVKQLVERVAIVVEDYPSDRMMRNLGIRHRAHLCGLFSGIPLGEKSVEHSGIPSDTVHLFREGIFHQAADHWRRVSEENLHEQIRVTLWHELGHLNGLDEEELDELGYG